MSDELRADKWQGQRLRTPGGELVVTVRAAPGQRVSVTGRLTMEHVDGTVTTVPLRMQVEGAPE